MDILNFINALKPVEARYILYLLWKHNDAVGAQLEEIAREWEALLKKNS